jgi:hypothetical protein
MNIEDRCQGWKLKSAAEIGGKDSKMIQKKLTFGPENNIFSFTVSKPIKDVSEG